MKLKVKKVEAIDIGPIRKMAEAFWKEMGRDYPNLDADELDKMMLFILSKLNDDNHIFVIAYDGKKPAGFFLGYIGEHEWGKPRRVAVAQELYVVPNKRSGFVGYRMIQFGVKIAMTKGIEAFECVGGYGSTDKRWERFGFTPHLTYGHMDMHTMMKIIGEKNESHKEDSYK